MNTKAYRNEFKHFMSFLGRQDELNLPEYDPMALLDVTPDQVASYLNMKAYGRPDPTPDCLPTHARANTLKASKKILSAFMPRRMITWDDVRSMGNPTRSIAVNDVIKKVLKHEVRKQGVETSARRPIAIDEFMNVLGIIRTNAQFTTIDRFRLGCVLTLQWHLIGRVDDMMKMSFKDLAFSPACPFSTSCQMRWSKNITEERDAPRQIVLASRDERLCSLLNLAVYLELLDCDPEHATFLFGNGTDGDRNIRNLLSKALDNSDFKRM